MAAFVVRETTPYPPAQAWARVVDWPAHGRYVPLTRVRVETSGPNGVGTVFTARTGIGPIGFDDPMEIVRWDPPGPDGVGSCRLEKRGRVMLGWAELAVRPHADGAEVTWREDAAPARLPRVLLGLATRAGQLLFGRVLRKLLHA